MTRIKVGLVIFLVAVILLCGRVYKARKIFSK
jgi:hypothetical protein